MKETIKNRKESYIETIKNLPGSQRRVYDALDESGPMTNREISVYLHLPVNCITGRCKELRDNLHVIEHGTIFDNLTKRNVTVFKVNYNLFNQNN